MNGGSRIIDLRGRPHDGAPVEPAALPTADPMPGYDPPRGRPNRLVIAGVTASLLWIGTMAWLAWPELRVASTIGIVNFVAALWVPPALLGIVRLIAILGDRTDPRGFAVTTRTLREEAGALEATLVSLSARTEENRAALAQQVTALMAVGDTAATRLASIGAGIAEQSARIEQATRTIEAASGKTITRLEKLVAELPGASAQAGEIAQLLDRAAARTAESAQTLDAQFAKLGDRGRAARDVADDAADALIARIGELDAATAAAQESIAAGTGIVAQIAARVDEGRAASLRLIAEVETGVTDTGARIEALQRQGTERNSLFATSIAALTASADTIAETMDAGNAAARRMIGTAENALTACDAVAREVDETLPAALDRLDARIGESRAIVTAAKPELLSLVTAAESTLDAISSIADVIAGQHATLDRLTGALQESLGSSQDKADALNQVVDETLTRTRDFIREAAPQLIDALLRVRETASNAAERAREALGVVIPEAANALEVSSTAALKRAAAASIERQVVALAEAADIAVAAAQRASDRLTRQLLTIADTTAAVETRIDAERAERDTFHQKHFSRRSAALIDALNSASIDLGSALGVDTPDSAWAAYLKGDRGVFTRRAVRLLDGGEARDVATLYADDPGFRDQVNRYIHDFEAMLRGILAQPEGGPLGVTLLSSDMGKLYVALAQAIDRLRS